jgi:HEAT repeat protein
VRKSAVRALGRKRSRSALLALREALYDAEATVREEALRGLARVAKVLSDQGQAQVKQDVADWLRDVLAQGKPSEQALARSTLLRLGDESQRPALVALQASPDRETRQILIEGSDRRDEGGLLVAMLADADPGVRSSAAQKLAEQGDRRALPTLREALSTGGRGGVMAFALLRRLGEQVAPPRDLDRLLHGPDVSERMGTVEALGKLPAELAVPFLLDAARDGERLVRRLVAEVAADLPDGPQGPPGLPVLRLLQQDSDGGVRFRAAALIARYGDLSRFKSASPSPGKEPRGESDGVPRLLRPAAVESPPDAGVDPGPPPPDAGTAPNIADAGPGEPALPVEGSGDKALDAIGQLARKGLQAFSAKDFGKALKLLNKAEKQCEKKKSLAEACAQLSQELAVRIAQIYEKQDQLVEAMSEYEKALRVSAGQSKGVASLKGEAEAGQARLRGQLGRVTLPKTVSGRCREVTEWMLPGTNVVTINGAQTFVKVRPGEVQNLGSCP